MWYFTYVIFTIRQHCAHAHGNRATAAVLRYENSEKQRQNGQTLLFFRWRERPRPRISAEHKISLAVNSWQEQQKTARWIVAKISG
jgi:hypothetical protein